MSSRGQSPPYPAISRESKKQICPMCQMTALAVQGIASAVVAKQIPKSKCLGGQARRGRLALGEIDINRKR